MYILRPWELAYVYLIFLCRSLSNEDIRALVESGCPNLFRKAVNSAKRLRAYLRLDEGDVCSSIK